MLKSLSLIRSMFSSGKRSLFDGSALSKRVRDIPTINSEKIEQYCIAKAIHQKGKKAEIISILKEQDSLIVNKKVLDYLNVNTPSPLPELLAINQCLMMAEKNNMRDFIVYFSNGTIMNMSYLNIRDPVLLALIQLADQLLNQTGASLCHNPNFVNHHPVIQEEMNKKGRRS